MSAKSSSSWALICISLGIMLIAAWTGGSSLQSDDTSAGETEIHLAPGTRFEGKPVAEVAGVGGRLRLTITEDGKPTFCRVNVVGSDGNFYEPSQNLLAAWSLSRLGNREGKGPFRYYGWFFYSDGDCEIQVPSGETRIEVWKGLEYRPITVTKQVPEGTEVPVNLKIERTADLAAEGWYSGDTHIHLDRRNDEDDQRVLDLVSAEDIRFGHILCMNDPRTYQPAMDQQIWHQLQGMGMASLRTRGPYQITSGQEYRCGTYGHICLIGGSRLVDADGLKTDPNNWPPFGMVADELHGLGGYAFHAHGGYEKEIYIDFAQETTDGVELLQFAEYRGISLEGWYHILNAGYRFPGVGASDYPYCRALGDCRTYVHLSDKVTVEEWNRGAAAGRSFFTTGPLLQVKIAEKFPGETVTLQEGRQELSVQVRMQSLVSAVDEIQVIEGGNIVSRKRLTGEERNQPVEWKASVAVENSTWVAVRAFSKSAGGRVDSEAHTNPVYINVGKQAVRKSESIRWLLKRVNDLIVEQERRDFPQREQVLGYFRASRESLEHRLQQTGE